MNFVLLSVVIATSTNPFNPEFSASIRDNIGMKIPELVGNFGDRIDFFKTKGFSFSVDALSTNTFIHNGEDSFRLLFSDFIVSPTVSFKREQYSVELKYSHISSHLGDGLSGLLAPDIFSKDFVAIYADYKLNIGFLKLDKTIELGYAHKRSPQEINKLIFDVGGTIAFDNNPVYVSYDMFVPSKNGYFFDVLTRSFHIGFVATNKFRAAITFYNGYEYRGQIFKEKLSYIGIGLFYKG